MSASLNLCIQLHVACLFDPTHRYKVSTLKSRLFDRITIYNVETFAPISKSTEQINNFNGKKSLKLNKIEPAKKTTINSHR